jgi:two-component system, chemotaxis family, protein-glutamate methylesterase/glutaminase
MANRDIVVIGTSAGGVEALLFLAKNLPSKLPASILVTLHLPPHAGSVLDEVLTRAGPLQASFARSGDVLRRGRIYIAPPGCHLIVEGERVTLGGGPRENNARPAIDPMFRSAALCCGSRTVGVVLTGTLDDGASGLWAIKQAGGITVVQDPREAAFPEMPHAALSFTEPDHIVGLAEFPALLERLVHEPAGEPRPIPDSLKYEIEVAKGGRSDMRHMDRIGRRSVLTCPDCDGVMWEIDEGELTRYRCHQGHAYSVDVMGVAIEESLRRALGSGLRALEERIALIKKLRRQAEQRDSRLTAANWADKARELEAEANTIRDSLRRIDAITEQEEMPERKAAAG